jgi:hypothetical protein
VSAYLLSRDAISSSYRWKTCSCNRNMSKSFDMLVSRASSINPVFHWHPQCAPSHRRQTNPSTQSPAQLSLTPFVTHQMHVAWSWYAPHCRIANPSIRKPLDHVFLDGKREEVKEYRRQVGDHASLNAFDLLAKLLVEVERAPSSRLRRLWMRVFHCASTISRLLY